MRPHQVHIAAWVAGGLVLVLVAPKLKELAAKVKQTATDLVSPDGSSPLSNPVSEAVGRAYGWALPSKAEREVDAMLATPIIPQPTHKAVLKPTAPSSGYENSPASFGTSSRAAGEVGGPSWEGFYGN